MKKLIRPLILPMLLLLNNKTFADIRLPAIIGRHMVLQQKSEVNIWGWADPTEDITIKVDWDTAMYTAIANFRTAKWNIKVKTPKAGGPYKITIEGKSKIILEDILIGEVWLCGGQSNMELSAINGLKQAIDEAPKANNPSIRFFYVPKNSAEYPQEDTKGRWVVCNPDDMKKFSAVGYFFGKRLQEQLQQPIGLINANWGGTGVESWVPENIINDNPPFLEAAKIMVATNSCCPIATAGLFNGMIYPIANYNISGVIWYQGETNRFTYSTYPSLLKAMVDEWRRLWQNNFPFYYVQIAPFSNGGVKNYVSLMKEAQTKCMDSISNSGMIVISDLVDDVNDVHPQNKLDVGLRLANYALAETYGKKQIAYKSPLYKRMQVEKNKIRIWFDNAENGLISKRGKPTDFFIAGDDKIFMPGLAMIEDNTIVVSNNSIKNPVAVRFGFTNEATPNLFNKQDLPVNLFRTDDWFISTEPVLKKNDNPVIGAIRWDAWYYGNSADTITNIIARNLKPKEFRNRLPFFAKEIGDDSLYINGSSQEVMDKEIGYAKTCGLDYWAFVTYTEYGLKEGLENYLKSKLRSDINFCLILEEARFKKSNAGFIEHVIKLIKEPGYQTVLDKRPLLYFGFIDSASVMKSWGSFQQMKRKLDSVRKVINDYGLGNPYVVIMDFDAKKGKQWSDSLGADAISSYVAQKNSIKASYKKLTEEATQFWEECKATGSQVVPICDAGWNPKPRIDNFSIWSKYYPKDVYYNHATPDELTDHIQSSLEWMMKNKSSSQAQCALIYAWNEHDEGGWLCPTLYEGTARIEAVGKMIRSFKEKKSRKKIKSIKMKFNSIIICLSMISCLQLNAQTSTVEKVKKEKEYTVAVYYFPNYHPDSINARWHGKGWTEWEVVKAAKPRFKGHEQPKVPSWGYFNEADPKWAAKEIDIAADNGIDCFIYDWYWYSNTGQYLQEGLEKGFLKAPNRNRLRFALMWANHDWLNIQPATLDNGRVKLTEGEVSIQLWDTISTYVVDNYFKQPNYWKIDGKPYFSIYEIVTFINGLGGIENAKAAIELLDKKTKAAGFPGVHFNVMSWMVNDGLVKTITGPNAPANPKEMLSMLATQSVSTYAYIHHFDYVTAGFPTAPYKKALDDNKKYWKEFTKNYPDLLYTPNVSMGWDASPRCMQTDKFEPRDYPWTPVVIGNSPGVFKNALLDAKKFLDEYNTKHKIVVLNSWNEWTEGSYLLPEKKYGDAYLKAIKAVFGN